MVGLDPGNKNIPTMADGDGNFLRYITCQKNFESKLMRYRKVLSEERCDRTRSIPAIV